MAYENVDWANMRNCFFFSQIYFADNGGKRFVVSGNVCVLTEFIGTAHFNCFINSYVRRFSNKPDHCLSLTYTKVV